MTSEAPQILPVLSRGKHRSPKRGACFMELASFLAGESWSDHPACTHPLLAHVARLVNDFTSDAARPRLAPMIPSVIGLTSADRRWDHEITVLAAARVIPVAAEQDQRALAVGMLTCERLALEEGLDSDRMVAACREAEDAVPLALEWAWEFIDRHRVGTTRHHPGPAIINCAVPALANACIPDPDTAMRELLQEQIDLCRALAADAAPAVAELDPTRWLEVCQPASVS